MMNLYFYHTDPDSLLWGDVRLQIDDILRDELMNTPNAAKNPKFIKAAIKSNNISMLLGHGGNDKNLRKLVIQSTEEDQLMYIRTLISFARGYQDTASWIKFDRFVELEPVLLQSNMFDIMIDYATFLIKGRWGEEGERIIAQSDKAANYAMTVVKKRWKEGEPYLANNAKQALDYTRFVTHKRFPKAEPTIKKALQKMADDYNTTIYDLVYKSDEDFIYQNNLLNSILLYIYEYPESEDVIVP